MTHYDVFNGDADGLCALHQLRLAEPRESVLVTGVKRDNALLARVPAGPGDSVCALDIALPGNRDALLALLARGVKVLYVDHHEPGEVPVHALLEATIDTAPDVCTSVLVDRRLRGFARRWAVVAAFGDNLAPTARALGAAAGADEATLARWQALGECLNYNAYGMTEHDLVYTPAALYRALAPYADPDRFIDGEPHGSRLDAARREDLARAHSLSPALDGPGATLRVLPDAAWARRAVGSLANVLASADARRAHAVAVASPGGALLVSVRVPASAPTSADAFCKAFGGGGRRIAAGIDALAPARLDELREALAREYPAPAPG
ncbi:MAG: acetyltransferase [Burkholderiaceae bacterium]